MSLILNTNSSVSGSDGRPSTQTDSGVTVSFLTGVDSSPQTDQAHGQIASLLFRGEKGGDITMRLEHFLSHHYETGKFAKLKSNGLRAVLYRSQEPVLI